MKRKEKQRMRRLSALFLSLMLICALSMTAFATEENKESTPTGGSESTPAVASEHEYTAYQIFKGVYSTDAETQKGKLSSIEWGANAKDTVLQSAIATALGVDATLESILDKLGSLGDDSVMANQLAAAIASNIDRLGTGQKVADGNGNFEDGYYIVIDTTETIGKGDTRNISLLQCTDGTITINKKTVSVTSDKQVMDMNDSNAGDGTNNVLGTSADYDIGDKVPFELTGTVAENFDQFQGDYKFVFHDTESAGLTFNNDVIVTIGGTQITSGFKVDTKPEDGDTFEVIFDDLKQIPGVQAGSEIKISYTATLNDGAVIGSAGNENKMYLEYSSNPYVEGETGTTPEKAVIVFTYQVQINKVDQKGDPLTGAEFALYKFDCNYDGDDGKSNADGSKQNVLGEKCYNKLVLISTKNSTDTFFSFEGIDDGEYLLVETKTPDGYNSIEPVEFTVTAGHAGGALTSLNGNPVAGAVQLAFTPDAGSGTLKTDVENKSGSLLPSTGGIGTTMFYIIGGVLMVGACMMLFVRKIMTNEKR